MAKKQALHVVMQGTGIREEFYCLSHTMHPNPGGTYHEFLLLDGETILLFNDFGLQKIVIGKSTV